MKVLLTGFEPFGDSDVNPSGAIVECIAATPGVDVATSILPVSFAETGDRLRAAIDAHAPDLLLMLGQGGGTAMRIERVGLNWEDIPGRQDNRGLTREEHPIDPAGPAAYFATIPVRGLVKHLNEHGFPAVESLSAGGFLCNHVLYAARHSSNAMVGFIHLPLLPQQAAAAPGRDKPASMGLETQVAAIRAALDYLRRSGTNAQALASVQAV